MKLHLFTLPALFLLLPAKIFAQTATEPSELQAPTTVITFEGPEFEFGQIEAGEIVQNVFVFKNTGDQPLIITNAKGSCGCTVPRWPKEPVLPGESAELLVQFDSKNKKGKQSKRVTVTANTDPAQTFLTIRGDVMAASEAPARVAVPKENNNQNIDAKRIEVYPNPATDQLFISIKEFENQAASIALYNNLGQQIADRQVDGMTAEPIMIDISQFAEGTYTVSVKLEGMMRVVKQVAVNR